MVIVLLCLFSIAAFFAGRLIMGRWFNHLSLYSAIWGLMLALEQTNLMGYRPLSFLAWAYIFIAWMSLFLGALLILPPKQNSPIPPVLYHHFPQTTAQRRTRWFLQALGLIGAVLVSWQALAVVGFWGAHVARWISIPSIVGAWALVFSGLVWSALPTQMRRDFQMIEAVRPDFFEPRLRTVIWAFSLIGAIAVISTSFVVFRRFGSIGEMLYNANILYNDRLRDPELAGNIDYVGAFAQAACPLAGIYTARLGKLTLTATLPFLVVCMSSVLAMGRAVLLLALVSFVVAFVLTPGARLRFRSYAAAILILAIPVGGVLLINSTRGLTPEFGNSSSGSYIADHYPAISSQLFYFTGPAPAFSDYLEHRDREKTFVGMYTFAPIFRFAARLGAPTRVPYYEEFYYTPIPINILTWLKNLYCDFGPFGIVLFPMFLSAVVRWLTIHLGKQFSVWAVVVLVHCYMIIAYSIFYNTMLQGQWYVGLILGLIAGWWVHHQSAPDRTSHFPTLC